MKAIIFFLTFLFVSKFAFCQSNYSIRGSLVDSSLGPMEKASVFLLLPKDSSLVTFTRSDAKGNFQFKNLKRQDYLIKSSFVGYLPMQNLVKYDVEKLNNDVGAIKMKIIQRELYEVVIKTAKAPMSFKGDTIEYDATKFKVPPGSSVEELLRRLPGVQVDAEGNIKAQGEKVNKVLVDGKRFFGDDPKVATKSLPAEAITKVQVFNDASEQSKLTGVSDGKHEKTVNLELKEEFKKGGFGKVTAGVGSKLMGKANYNKFDSKNQFSVLGFGNNVNQTGLSNNDYQDFKGSQSYNWNNNADFGFNNGGMMNFSFGSDADNSENMEIPQTWGPGSGFSKNLAGGLNYNYDTKKMKVSSNYFYNRTKQDIQTQSDVNYFLPNATYSSQNISVNNNILENHRASFRIEKELDSLNKVIVNVNAKYGNKWQDSNENSNFLNSTNELFRKKGSLVDYSGNNLMISSAFIYRKKFKLKGKNFAVSASYNKNGNNQSSNQISTMNEFTVNGQSFPIAAQYGNFAQNIDFKGNTDEYKSSLLFIQPFKKKYFVETFYNFSYLTRFGNRNVFNPNLSRIDSLSRYYDNTITYNRIGAALRYSFKGKNINIGLADQEYQIRGDFYGAKGGNALGNVTTNYGKVVPNFGLEFQLKNNKYFNMSYNIGVKAPTIKDLQPFTNNTNPMFISTGNPNLQPSISKNGKIGFMSFDPVTFINYYATFIIKNYDNQIVYNQTVDASLITHYSPVNISGGNEKTFFFGFDFPIKKTKITAGINTLWFGNKNLLYINDVLNTNITNQYQLGYNLNITPSERFSWFINGSSAVNTAKYSINESQNQQYINTDLSSSTVWRVAKNLFFTTDFTYNHYRNDKVNFNRHVPILNWSIYKIFGKGNKSEIRFSLYDTFKRNLGITQYASQNVSSRSVTQTLSRYFLVSYTYNMRGNSTIIKKNNWEN